MVMFHSYVSLPEGKSIGSSIYFHGIFPMKHGHPAMPWMPPPSTSMTTKLRGWMDGMDWTTCHVGSWITTPHLSILMVNNG
jgi:hypothetical protein